MITTEHLRIFPASEAEMRDFIRRQSSEILKAAYGEMLQGCLAHRDEWEWYAAWFIELHDGTHSGELCFKGLSSEGITEIGYGIDGKFQGHGYATEAATAVTEWALAQNGVNRVEAEAEADNIASIRVLTKCGFIPTGETGEEGLRFARAAAL